MRRARLALASALASALAAIWLGGCASGRPATESAPRPLTAESSAEFAATRGAIEAVSGWRLAARVSGNHGGHGFIGQLRWLRDDKVDRIELAGPLGGALFRLEAPLGAGHDGLGATVHHADGREERIGDFDAWLAAELGVTAPAGALGFWMRGIPDPARTHRLLSVGTGCGRSFVQDGVTVTVSVCQKTVHPALPESIEWVADSSAAGGAGATLRLAAMEWTLLSTGPLAPATHDAPSKDFAPDPNCDPSP